MAKKDSSRELVAPWSGAAPAPLADWEKEASAVAQQQVAGLPIGGNWLSIRGRSFKFGGTDHGNWVLGIPLDYAWEHAYYTGRFDPDNFASPACYAISKLDEHGIDHDETKLAPREVPDRQHVQCMGCPQNDFGSDDRGKGKACRNNIRLSLLLVGSDLIGEDSVTDFNKMPMALLRIPPTSKKNFTNYTHSIIVKQKMLLHSAVCQVSFDPKETTYPVLQFTPKYWVADHALKEHIRGLLKTCVADLVSVAWATSAEEEKPADKEAENKIADKLSREGRPKKKW